MKTLKSFVAVAAALFFGFAAKAGDGGILPETIGPATVGETFTQTFSVDGIDASMYRSSSLMKYKPELLASKAYDESGEWSSASQGKVSLTFDFPYGTSTANAASVCAQAIMIGGCQLYYVPKGYNPDTSKYQGGSFSLEGSSFRYRGDSSSFKILLKGTLTFSATGVSSPFGCLITLCPDGSVTVSYAPNVEGFYVGGGMPYFYYGSQIGYYGDMVELKDLAGDIKFRPLNGPQNTECSYGSYTFNWSPSSVQTIEFGISITTRTPAQTYARYYTLSAVAASPKPSIKTVEPETSSVELTKGETQSFEVKEVENADAATFSYRWYKFNSTVGSWLLISDATTAKYDYTQSDSNGTQIKVELAVGSSSEESSSEESSSASSASVFDSHIWTVTYKAPDPVVKEYVPAESPVEQKKDEPACLTVVLEDSSASAIYKWYKVDGGAGTTLLMTTSIGEFAYEGGDATQIKVEVYKSDGVTKIGENTWTLQEAAEDPSPEIETYEPLASSLALAVGGKTNFVVSAKSNAESEPFYSWYDNDVLITDGAGTPVATAFYEFEMTEALAANAPHVIRCQVMNNYGKTASQSWTVTKKVEPLTPALPSGSYLPEATNGVEYSYKLEATGGSGKIQWSMGGTLPTWLTLDYSAGVLSAKPVTGDPGEYEVKLMVNSGASSVSVTYKLKVGAAGSSGGGEGGGSTGGDKVTFAAKEPAVGAVAAEAGKDVPFEVEPSGEPTAYEYGFTLRDSKFNEIETKSMELSYTFNQVEAGTYMLIFEAKAESPTLMDEIEPLVWEITVTEAEKPAAKIFTQKNPGDVAMTVGDKQLFEVETTGDISGYNLYWYVTDFVTETPLDNGVTSCEYEATSEGSYEVFFTASSKTDESDYVYFAWSVSVAPAPVTTTITGSTPDPYECSTASLNKPELLTLADGEKKSFSIAVSTTLESLTYAWYAGSTPLSSTDTIAGSLCEYTHAASPEQTMITCCVFDPNSLGGEPIAYACWYIAETAEPLEIVTDAPVTDGMVENPYGLIQFGLKDDLGIAWDAIPQLKMIREASTFATAAAETAAGGTDVTKLTIQSGQQNRIFFNTPFNYSLLGISYSFVDVRPWYGMVQLSNGNAVDIYGLAGEWAFTKAGDGVYVKQFDDHVTIRWQGQRVVESAGGGTDTGTSTGTGTGTGTGDGGAIWTGNGTITTVTTNDATMAITLYATGEVRVSFGDCADALTLSGPTLYASGASSSLNLSYSNTTDEKAANADDVFFKSSLPPGLTFIAAGDGAGQLSGTPTKAGVYDFTISGKNGENPASTNLTITILENNIPKPAFADFSPKNEGGEPAFISVQVGATTNLSVVAENTTTIDWYVGDTKVATGAAFAFTPTQSQVGTYPVITCKLSNDTYKDYVAKSWTSHIAAAPLVLGLADGGTIPVHVKQFEPFNVQLSATGGASATYEWGHAQYSRVFRAEGSSWSNYATDAGWQKLDETGITVVNLSTPVSFCGTSYSIFRVETAGCLHFNGTTYASGLDIGLKLLMPFCAKSVVSGSSYHQHLSADEYAIRWTRFDKEEIRYVYGPGNVTSAENLPYIGYSDGASKVTSAVQLPGNRDAVGMGNAADIILTPQLPRGLALASDGTISGTTSVAPGTYELKLRLTCGWETVAVTYQLIVDEGDNKAPELISSTPSATNVVAYIDNAKQFSVNCTDADGDALTYQWKTLFGLNYETLGETGNTLNYTPDKGISKMLCYALDGVHEPTLVRTWDVKVKDVPLGFADSALPEFKTGEYCFDSEEGYPLTLTDEETPIESAEIVSGTLPTGVSIAHDPTKTVYIKGLPRIHGTYPISLKVKLTDGDEMTAALSIVVTGTDMPNITWYVDPVNGSYKNNGLSDTSAFQYMSQIGNRLENGDTICLLPGDHATRFAPVSDVSYVARGGEILFVGGSADTSIIKLENGATISYVVGGLPWRYDDVIDVVQVPGTAQAGDYTVKTSSPDFVLHGSPYIEDGWLRVKALWYYDKHGRINMTFADVPVETGRKTYTFENYTIPKAAMFFNEGGTNATVHIAGVSECSWEFCTFLWATNGVDLVMDDTAKLVCNEKEMIEGFDTLTFGSRAFISLAADTKHILVKRGVKPLFANDDATTTIELREAMDWGTRRALIWDFDGISTDRFYLNVPQEEDVADYQFQNYGNHLFLVKRYSKDGEFPNLEELCPAAELISESPLRTTATARNPMILTVGTPASFSLSYSQTITPNMHFVWAPGERWELEGVQLDTGNEPGCTIVPTDDMVDETKVYHLKGIVADYYHDTADEVDWYFKVAPAAPVVDMPRISAYAGAAFEHHLADYTTGGYGDYTYAFAETKGHDGLSLTSAGVLTGTMTADLDDEDVKIAVTDAWGTRVVFAQNLHLRTSENEFPYLVSATPEETAIDYMIGDAIRFSVTARDDEGDAIAYKWFVDDVEVGSATSYGYSDCEPAHETDVSKIVCKIQPKFGSSDDDWKTVKSWVITKCERPTVATSHAFDPIAVGTKDINIDLRDYCTTEEGAHIESFEIVVGTLPEGMELINGYIVGEVRQLGTSSISVQFTSSNGQQANARYSLSVTGEADTEPRTWWVAPYYWWRIQPGMTGTVHCYDFDSLLGVASGDTVNVQPQDDAELNDYADTYNRLGHEGVTFNFKSGTVRLKRAKTQPLDLSRVNREAGSEIAITLPKDDVYGEWAGEIVRIAKLPTRSVASDPTVTTTYSFDNGVTYKEDGYLTARLLSFAYSPNEGVDYLKFPDDALATPLRSRRARMRRLMRATSRVRSRSEPRATIRSKTTPTSGARRAM